MSRSKKKTTAFVIAAVAVFSLSAATSWGLWYDGNLIYEQDFESSTAASEYASGDFNPADAASPSTQVFRGESGGVGESAFQVVNASTDPNGGAAPQVMGLNSLKINSSTGGGCCPVMDVHPWGQGNSNSGNGATISLSFYGVPASGGSTRLLEVYGSPANGDPYGPFTFAFRFDEDGTVFYDSGGWQEADFTVSQNQWNDISIASFTDGSSPDWVTMTLNGTSFNNGGLGYGDANSVTPSISRYHFGGQTTAAPEGGDAALIFIDNVQIHNVAIPEPASLALLGIGFLMLRRFRRVA